MDQYVFTFKINVLFFDYLALIQTIYDSGNEELLPYLPEMRKIAEEEYGAPIDWDSILMVDSGPSGN
jgi:hypothetical protein